MDAFITTIRMGRLYQDNTLLWDLCGVSSDSALDTYVGLTGMPNPTGSISSLGAFTLELESFPTSTTHLESDKAESVLPLSSGIASNEASINSSKSVDWLTGIAVDAALVGDLKNGEYTAKATLSNLDNSHFKDELTTDRTVSLTQGTFNPFTGTSLKVSQVNDFVVTSENFRAILTKDYRFKDELTTDRTVSLTQGINNPFTGTSLKVSQVNNLVVTSEKFRSKPSENYRFKDELTTDRTVRLSQGTNNLFTSISGKVSQVSVGIIKLQNQGAILTKDYRFLDGLTADGTVSLAASTNNTFTSTKQRVFNIPDELRSDNPTIEESRENVTPKFLRKVFEILERLDTVPEYFMAVMEFEPGASYSSSERNDLSESVGLIQFTENGVQHPCTRGLASR